MTDNAPIRLAPMTVAYAGEVPVHGVEVELLNDAGERAFLTVKNAPSVDEAVALAEQTARDDTEDDTWTMNETRPV